MKKKIAFCSLKYSKFVDKAKKMDLTISTNNSNIAYNNEIELIYVGICNSSFVGIEIQEMFVDQDDSLDLQTLQAVRSRIR